MGFYSYARLGRVLPIGLLGERSKRYSTLLYWCARWCGVRPLLFGERGDELAAEVRDVGDDAAPDQVRGGREAPDFVSEGPRW
jgi:hypothetical protein